MRHIKPQPVQPLSYTVDAVVTATGIARSAIYVAITSGQLRSFKAGRRRMFTAEAVRDWLASMERAA